MWLKTLRGLELNAEDYIDVTLLSSVTGIIRPGTKTLLIGPYRSGKTTLMELLTGRKAFTNSNTRFTSGLISVNGLHINDCGEYLKHVAYVPQQDVHMPTLTVRQALMFSANMRLPPSVSAEEKEKIVEDVIDRMGLREAADVLTGNQILRGISGGQKRRLTIGCELVIQPKFICLDEPTNGLDSSTAMQTLIYLSELAESGTSVVCTLQQPSFEQYEQFDNVIVMTDRKIMFAGRREKVVDYFENTLGCRKMKTSENPADFITEMCESKRENLNERDSSVDGGFVRYDVDDWATEFSNSSYGKRIAEDVSECEKQVPNVALSVDLSPSEYLFRQGKYFTSFATQLSLCLKRGLLNVARDPAVLEATIGRSIMVGLLLGTLFFDIDHDQQGARLLSFSFLLLCGYGRHE